jgi:acyl-CoA synthetase (AMP-forming)/AMP-acid ligase II
MNLAEILRQQALQRGAAPALIEVWRGVERKITFKELDDFTGCLADRLAADAIGPGAGALIFHPMSASLYIFLIALFRVGATALFLDPSVGRAHIQQCCTMWPPQAFFGSPRAHFLRLGIPALHRIPRAYSARWFPGSLDISRINGTALQEIRPVSDRDIALMTFTSGSTGRPKAAARTHRFLLAQHKAIAESLGLGSGRVDLATLPIFVLANLGSGVTTVIPNTDIRNPGMCKIQPVIEQIDRHQVESLTASPALVARLASECEHQGRVLLSLRKVFTGGAPVFPRVLHSARKSFPNAAVTALYGSTEAEPMAEISLDSISSADFRKMQEGAGLLAGKPVPSIDLRVIGDQWGTPIRSLSRQKFSMLAMPVGSAGEIVVSGEHVLPGYFQGEGDSETKFDVEETRWHRTGDLGYFDASGRLWLLGRCSAKVSDQKGTIYPFAAECAAQHDPRVRLAALAAVDGKRVLAIELVSGTSVDSSLKANLAWAQLDRIVALRRIPLDRRHNAKVDYPRLAKLLR